MIPTALERDRFGNPLDPKVGYARGRLIANNGDEIRRTLHGRRLVRERIQRLGPDSVYNLTALVRSTPLAPEDLPRLLSQFHFYGAFDGKVEPLAIAHMGGNPAVHAAQAVTRVSAGMLAIYLALLQPGDTVLSVVPRPTSHPSIRNAVALAGGRFVEVVGVEAAARWLAQNQAAVVAITPTTPSKYVLPEDQGRQAIALARAAGARVMLDDAHMVSRAFFFGQARTFALGDVDVAITSLDKHIFGPRAGVIVGKAELLPAISTVAYTYGLEAQAGHYTAIARALQAFPDHHQEVQTACSLARTFLPQMQAQYGADRVYPAGPGVAISADDILDIAVTRAGGTAPPALVPVEATNVVAMTMLERHGIVTIPTVAMPGSSPAMRIMMFPDAGRRGLDVVQKALAEGLDRLAGMVRDPQAAAATILGS